MADSGSLSGPPPRRARAFGLALVGFGVLLVGPVSGQSLPLQTYSSDDGLAQSVVLALHQDSGGYLWIGTPNGISRFDGLRFETWAEADGLADLVVRTIVEARDGSVWVGTDEGVSVYRDGRWDVLSDLPRVSFRALVEASDGTLWGGTWGRGLWRLGPGPPASFGGEHGLEGDRIRALAEDPSGDLLVGDYGAGLFRVETGGEEIRITRSRRQPGNLSIRALGFDPGGRLVVGTNRGAWRRGGDGFERVTDETFSEVSSIITDTRGRLWIGTRDRGACALDGTSTTCIGLDRGMADDSVNCLLQDREGNLWFGTFGGGVSRLVTGDFVNWTGRDGLPSASVQAFARSRDGSFWMGTHGGGLLEILPDGSRRVFSVPDLPHEKVLSLLADDDSLWIGTLDGLARRGADGAFESWSVADGLSHEIVFDIARSEDGTIWLATLQGFTELPGGATPDSARPIVHRLDGAGPSGSRVNYIEPVSDGSLWIATGGGVVRRGQDGDLRRWTEADGLADDFVDTAIVHSDGSVWFATSGGLVRWTPAEGFRTWGTEDGLPHDKITAMLEDHEGRLWMGTTRGVAIFEGGSFRTFSARDGLVSSEVNQRAIARDADGGVWVGTVAGAVRFDAGVRMPTVPPPPAHLTSLEVLGEPVDVQAPVTLPWDRNDLTFRFVGLSLTYPQDVSYRYRLQGLDDRWRFTSSRTVEFAGLPPGRYELQVEARVRDGAWSPAPAGAFVELRPPFWGTWWFRSAVLTALGALLLLWHRGRLRTVRERSDRLEEMNERLEEMVRRRREAEDEVRRYAGELERANLYDEPTGLPNRALFLDRLRVALESSRTESALEARLAVLLIDLDRFKLIVESHGHKVGDEVLAVIADRLATSVGPRDTVARMGGDEFAILRDRLADSTEASRFAEQIHERLSRPVSTGAAELVVTASIGLVFGRSEYEEPEEILRDADAAMYRAKAQGRGHTAVFDPDMQARAVEQLQLENDLRRGLDRDELELRFQPIVEIATGAIVGLEALMRWRHPKRGFLLPGSFLPQAEDAGLSTALDDWALEAAFRQAVRWRESPAMPQDLTIAVNISGGRVVRADLPDRLGRCLRETGLDPALIRLEITEDVLIEETEEAARVLAKVRELGVRLSLDDFGTGFSSLSYLQRFPFDVLKIDRSFVSRLDCTDDGSKIVTSMIQLAGSLGIEVVAEGVETNEQLEILGRLGCRYAQGYLFARALSPAEVEEVQGRDLPRAVVHA